MNTTDLASSSNTPCYKLLFDNLPPEANYHILHQTLYFYSHPNGYPHTAIEPINTLLSARKVSQNLKDTIDYYPYGAGMLFQAIGQLHNIYLRTNQTNDIEYHSKDSFEISNYRYIADFLYAVIQKLSMNNDNWKDLLAHSLNRIYREDYDSRDIIEIVFNRMYIQYVSNKRAYSCLPSFQYGLLHWGARFFKNQFSSHKFLSLCLEQSQDLMILDENQSTPLHARVLVCLNVLYR